MVHLNRVLKVVKENGGFINEIHLKWLKIHCPDRQVLVRTNLGRFLCAIKEVEQRIAQLSRDNYLRDVSFPPSDPIWA